jgi:neutral ceramidase
MGYADLNQIGSGLRQRLYARSFIIGDPENEADRFVYMVLDTQSGDTAIRYGILDGVKALGSDYAAYGQSNVAVTGTHSHSGPGAWLNYLLPTITSKGFDKQSYQAIVDGGILSIKRAHESLTEGTLSFGNVDLQDANINRSPYAYLANPEEERSQYGADVDKFMTMLKFTRSSDSKAMGILSWFPVHGTSMLGNNTYASGDNKGVAMDLFEKSVKGSDSAADGFVAGFSQSNVGDTTPNVLGAWCEDGSNVQCTFERSLCSGKTENCHGRGPNFTVSDNGATSCFEIGSRQFKAAKSLYDDWESKSTAVTGSTVRSFHTFQDMRGYNFTLSNGTDVSTCAAALGNSFAAGTSDWPGAFDFKQGDNDSPDNPVWNVVGSFLHPPTEEQKRCQGRKPVLLDVGNVHQPYDWSPNIVDIQVMRAGQFYFVIAPGEATTMSGRRWKKAIVEAAKNQSDAEPYAIIGGPANTYAHYIATPEEYEVQRYEGASTLFGPHTLDAYIDLTTKYLPYLSSNPPSDPLEPGPSPPNNVDKAISFITGVVYDNPPIGKKFGDIVTDVAPAPPPRAPRYG